MIGQICVDKGISLTDLEKTIPISLSTIIQLKTGHVSSIKAEIIVEICLRYQYSILWVMTGRGNMKSDNEAKTTQEEIVRIRKNIEEIIKPLLNELLQPKVTIQQRQAVINDLLKNISKQ